MIFKVPQFIEVEDKIFGPFTFKQFVYMLGGAGAAFVLWQLLPSYIAIIFIIPIAGLGGALAFYKVNRRPFVITLQAFLKFVISGRLYIWKHEDKKKVIEKTKKVTQREQLDVPRLSGGRLKDLAWSLDVSNIERNENE